MPFPASSWFALLAVYLALCLCVWLCTFFPATPLFGSQLPFCRFGLRNRSRIDLLRYDATSNLVNVDNGSGSESSDFPGRFWISPSELDLDAVPRMPRSQIPQIIHQSVSSKAAMSNDILRMAASWTFHRDWVHVLWDDCDRGDLVANEAPHLLPLMNLLPKQVQRADIFRNIVLQVYGGVYADTDFECVNGIEGPDGLGIDGNCGAYIVGSSTVRVDGSLQGAMMASVPGHPFWDVLLANASVTSMPTFFQSWFGTQPVIQTTGPRFLSNVFDQYTANQVVTNHQHQHTPKHNQSQPAAPAESEFPEVSELYNKSAVCRLDPGRFNSYGDKTSLSQLRLDKLRRTVHRGMHSWGKGRKGRRDTPSHHAAFWIAAVLVPPAYKLLCMCFYMLNCSNSKSKSRSNSDSNSSSNRNSKCKRVGKLRTVFAAVVVISVVGILSNKL